MFRRILKWLGGIILLAIAGTLPELAITVSAASRGNLDLAAGNLIGGIAVQTMVLVTAAMLMGALLSPSTSIGGVVSPASVAIVVMWLVGVYVINRARKAPRWSVSTPGSRRGRTRAEKRQARSHPYAGLTTLRVAVLFAAASAVTLVAGVVLEVAGNTLAGRAGIDGVIFGATLLATATALPEISSGIAAVRLGDNALAIGDIFGGNAFQLCLFLVADIVAGAPVLTKAGRLNGWLAGLGIVLTAIYAIGVVGRPYRTFARLGPDSVLAILVFGLGVAGLVVLPR